MDEQTNEAVVEEQVAEEVVESDISEEAFDAIWDDDDGDFAEQVDYEEADQPIEQPEEEPTEPTEAEAEEPDADQYLELKHFDEVKKVNKEEAKVLAQKGLDYDRIRQRADADSAKVKFYEDFFNEIKGDFSSIGEMMVDTLARVRSEKQGRTYEEVRDELMAANQQAQQKAQAPTREQIQEQMRKESLGQFLQKYPGVKAETIPKEVWDDMRVTNNLVASYERYNEMKKLVDENKILKQNEKNKARSTGSMKSSGKGSYERSEFDRVFDDDEY